PGEFNLLGMEDADRLDVPVIQRPMDFELQCTDGMCDAFNGVRLAMRIIVHGINTPVISGTMMTRMENAIHDWIAEVEVGGVHVDLGAERSRAVGELARLHAAEQVEACFHRPIAVRARLAALYIAAGFRDLVSRQVVDVSLAVLDQLLGPLVELI